MAKKLLLTILISIFCITAKAQYTQILHTSGTVQYSCTQVNVGPWWWYYYYNQGYYNGVNWFCGVGPYSDSSWNNQYYYWWGGYQFKFTPAVSAVRFQIADLQYGEWVEFYVNGNYYPVSNSQVSAFPGTCGQGTLTNYGYLYNNTQNSTQGAQVDIVGNIDSIAVLTSGGYYYYNNNAHDITYSAYFLDPNYINPTLSSNNPTCGGVLNLYCSTVTGATYYWTGPNNFTSSLQNPVVGTATYLQSGTYTCYVTTNCGTFPYTITVNIATPTAPTVTNNTINYCVGQTSTALTATGTNLLWYTQQYGGVGSSTAPVPSTAVAGSFTWWVSQTVNGCESDRTAIMVIVNAIPAAPGVSSNSPVCSGNQIQLSATSGTGATFAWTGPNSFTSNIDAPGIANAQSVNAGTYSVTSTINGCTSPAATVNVVVNPTPLVTTITPQNPTMCNGTNGQITFSTLSSNTSYTVNYNKNNVAQAQQTITTNGSGVLTLGNLTAGMYSSIVITTLNGCSVTIPGPYTLTDPAAPSISLTSTNNTNCATPTGSITLHNLTPGTYTVNYTYNGTPQTPITTTITGVNIVLNNLQHGNYTNITVTNTTTGCISNIVNVNISGPQIPTIYSSITNPTVCNTSTGSILITGLTSGTSYSLNYTQNGNPVTVTQTAVNGSINITGLPAGTYTNIFVVVNGCASNVLGPLSLVDPSSPATPSVNANTPICAGQTLNLTASSTTSGVTYNWTGPNSFGSTQQNPNIPNVQVVNAGLYSVTATLNNCTSAAGTVNVTVNALPATPTGGSNTPVCSGNALNLTATSTTTGATYSWTGPNSFSSLQQNPNIPAVTTAASGQYTVYAVANGCNSLPYSFNVNVVGTPVITATSVNPSTCGGNNGSITILGLVNGSSYAVNYDKNGIPQGQLTLVASGGSVTIPNLQVGTYTNITATLNGCPSNILGPITLNGPITPPSPTAASNAPLCEGDNLSLTATTVSGATYSWTGPNSFTANTQNASIPNVTTAVAGTYSVMAIVNGCNSLPATVNVVVNPQVPTPTATNNGPLCAGDNLALLGTLPPGQYTYSWSGPGGFSSNLQNPSIPNAQLVNNGLYTLTVSNGTCSNSGTTNVAVNPIPLAPIVNGPVQLCLNEVTQLTAQGQNLRWYTQPTGGTGQPTMTPPTSSATTMTYYVSQTVNGCESPRTPLNVVVNPLPPDPTATNSYTYCQDEPGAVQLSATGTNLTWYDVAVGGTPLAGAPTPNTSIPGTFNYYVTQSDVYCESNRTQITVVINPTPGLPVVEQLQYCQDAVPAPLSAQGQNLLWYNAATGGTGSATAPVPNTSVPGTTDYYVSQTINNCEGGRSLIRVIVHEKVSASLTANPELACVGKPVTITFTGSGPDTASYIWTFDGGDITSGSGQGPYTIVWNDDGSKTVTITVNNHTCTASASATIDVDPTPVALFEIQPDGCLNEAVEVKVDQSNQGMPAYTWDFAGATILSGSGQGPYTVSWNTPGLKSVSLQLTGINCPSDPHLDTIVIHAPEAKINNGSATSEICSEDSVFFTAQPGLDYAYTWSPAVYFRKQQASSELSQSVWGVIPFTSYVTLMVEDRWGCIDVDSVLVTTTPCCNVFLPNAFTPNADGKNDIFRMVTKGHQDLSRFIIVDRWGKIVFETANQHEGWDGNFNGKPAQVGTYEYYLKYRCAESKELTEMKGDVILVR